MEQSELIRWLKGEFSMILKLSNDLQNGDVERAYYKGEAYAYQLVLLKMGVIVEPDYKQTSDK